MNRHDRRTSAAAAKRAEAELEAMYTAAYMGAAALAGHAAGLAAVVELKRQTDAALIAEMGAHMPSAAKH